MDELLATAVWEMLQPLLHVVVQAVSVVLGDPALCPELSRESDFICLGGCALCMTCYLYTLS